MVDADTSGRLEKQLALGFLEHKGEWGRHVSKHADNDHLEGGERHGNAQADVQDDGHNLDEGAGG